MGASALVRTTSAGQILVDETVAVVIHTVAGLEGDHAGVPAVGARRGVG
jgi:hypothetical protein